MHGLRDLHLICVPVEVTRTVDAGEAPSCALPKMPLDLGLPRCKQPSGVEAKVQYDRGRRRTVGGGGEAKAKLPSSLSRRNHRTETIPL